MVQFIESIACLNQKSTHVNNNKCNQIFVKIYLPNTLRLMGIQLLLHSNLMEFISLFGIKFKILYPFFSTNYILN